MLDVALLESILHRGKNCQMLAVKGDFPSPTDLPMSNKDLFCFFAKKITWESTENREEFIQSPRVPRSGGAFFCVRFLLWEAEWASTMNDGGTTFRLVGEEEKET